MSALVDTGVLVAFYNERDARHERAVELVADLKEGTHGAAFVSDYVFDESISLTQARSGRVEVVRAVGGGVFPDNPEDRWVVLLHVSTDEFYRSWESLKRHTDARLSFTDWTIVEMVRSRGIDAVVSFDSGLDAWVRRFS